jgi:alpha-1,3-fucosyltransferase
MKDVKYSDSKSRAFVKYFLFSLLILKIIFLLYLIKSSNKSIQKKYAKFISNEFSSVSAKQKCNPINSNSLQYKVKIDNKIYPRSIPIFSNLSINFECLNQSTIVKKIFIWNAFFKDKSFGYGSLGKFRPFVKNNCPVTKCELLNDRNRLNESDLVLVHMRDDPIDNPPKFRPANQRWVFVLFETPMGLGPIHKWNGFFNLTSSYMLNSDFSSFYESKNKFIWKKNDSFDVGFNYLKGKKKFAAAVISNCGATNKRLLYIKKLRKYIKVDVYGRCGTKCSKSFGKLNCKEKIASIYKFYFAFENNLCKDYITEKFFSILKYPIIPVVLGSGNYEHFIPKSGYINALDFKTPKKFANYLKYVSKNPSVFNSYFKWKQHVSFYQNRIIVSPLCEMCIQLHLESYFGIKKKVIHNISKMWSKKENCYHKLFHFFKYILRLKYFNKNQIN